MTIDKHAEPSSQSDVIVEPFAKRERTMRRYVHKSSSHSSTDSSTYNKTAVSELILHHTRIKAYSPFVLLSSSVSTKGRLWRPKAAKATCIPLTYFPSISNRYTKRPQAEAMNWVSSETKPQTRSSAEIRSPQSEIHRYLAHCDRNIQFPSFAFPRPSRTLYISTIAKPHASLLLSNARQQLRQRAL
jgi:hypothetical protein